MGRVALGDVDVAQSGVNGGGGSCAGDVAGWASFAVSLFAVDYLD